MDASTGHTSRQWEVLLPSTAATQALAGRVAPRLGRGDCLLLEGPIGAGKTTFARRLIQALIGEAEDVPSPTFTLVQTYIAPDHEIWHCDLYRVQSADELVELGLEDALNHALTLIEWPDRMSDLAPLGAQRLFFEPTDDGDARMLRISGDDRWGEVIE